MDDIFKKLLYAGVGLVTVTAEKMQESVDRLVTDGKLSQEDGKSVLNELIDQTESRKEDVEEWIKDFLENTFERLNFIPKSDYEKLEVRVAKLEARLLGLEVMDKTTDKPIVRRTVKKIKP